METSPELVEAVKRAAVVRDGKQTLPCAQAFKLAEEYDAALSVIGRVCNEQRIKIVHCQLGCFK